MKHDILFVLIIVCLLTGCGAGGGGGDSGGSGNSGGVTAPGSDRTFGSRVVPGYAIQIEPLGSIRPGTAVTVQANVTAEDGQPLPAQIEAAISRDEPTTWVAGSLVVGRNNSWKWSVVLPADLTGQRVWVRITDPAGNMTMTGRDDFPLLP